MNALKNKVHLIGNLGADPDVKTLSNGNIRAQFRLATSESYKNSKGDRVTETQWHTVVAWGKSAEIVENYLKKGNQIAVEGKLIHRSYDSKEGDKRFVTEVIASDILMLDRKAVEQTS